MKRLFLGLLALALAAGLIALVILPAAGSQYRLWRDARSIRDYRRAADALDTLACGTLLAQARRYNEGLTEIALRDAFDQTEFDEDAGAAPLDVSGNGVIAVLEIPKLGATLPVYRGASQGALARGTAHLAGTSLPVGGEGTHCVLAGQGGGQLTALFDGLDRLMPGDCFYVQTLQDTLIYEVTGLETLPPEALTAQPIEGEADLCTLLTAMPQGEGERLLVRARRIARRETPLEDDTQVLPNWAARLIFAAPLALAGWLALALVEGARRAARRRRLRKMRI